MKRIYKVCKSVKIFVTCFFILMAVLGILFLKYSGQVSFLQRLIALIGIIFFIISILAILKIKVTIDNNQIEVRKVDIIKLFNWRIGESGVIVQNFLWSEISELTATYILFPENPIIILKPKVGINKKNIEFILFGISLDLFRDILSYLPSDTKIYLYPYLKKMLERKADSKRKIIIIAVLLIIMVIVGFLISWFFWK